MPMVGPHGRRLPGVTEAGRGRERIKASRTAMRAALREVKALDSVLDDMRGVLEDMYRGIDPTAKGAEALSRASGIADALWEKVSEAYVLIQRVDDGTRVRAMTPMEKASIRQSRAYPDDPKWLFSTWRACPACGNLLLEGPREGELFCCYCMRLREGHVEAPYETVRAVAASRRE